MPDSIMYQEDGYVVLETDKPEQFLTPEELLAKLKGILQQYQDALPRDLRKFDSLDAQAKYLMETSCEFDVGAEEYLQWYVVRLEK
ncbi:MAG: chlororespiratory reduction protein 7 [Oscillatoria sp. PMC 1051.18]|nr:chlororespiratory reduction protein 7 [Oscillatoria sp. PMC 1050.18]MEC5029831.1 chlororespiratory reduction protein 7 [Oscillatoria sp. PMC 1051.18]